VNRLFQPSETTTTTTKTFLEKEKIHLVSLGHLREHDELLVGQVDVLLGLVKVDSVRELDEGEDDEPMDLGGEGDDLARPGGG